MATLAILPFSSGPSSTLAAAEAIAGLVSDEQLSDEFIMPEAFDPRVADVVSKAVRDHIQ